MLYYYIELVPFTHQALAYGSLFWVIGLLQVGLVAAGVLMAALNLLRGFIGEDQTRMAHMTANQALFWTYIAGSSAVIFIVLFVLPYVI